MNRGDVYTALFAFSDGSPPKLRPMLMIQSDFYNQRIKKVLLATITSNLARTADPAHLLIDVSTPEGAASGLRQNSLVSCLNIVVLPQSDVKQKISTLSDGLMQRVDDSLKAALGL
jgi:mRNA-degrading endonuclease toxin of MazEF toxin-antitoxin module